MAPAGNDHHCQLYASERNMVLIKVEEWLSCCDGGVRQLPQPGIFLHDSLNCPLGIRAHGQEVILHPFPDLQKKKNPTSLFPPLLTRGNMLLIMGAWGDSSIRIKSRKIKIHNTQSLMCSTLCFTSFFLIPSCLHCLTFSSSVTLLCAQRWYELNADVSTPTCSQWQC